MGLAAVLGLAVMAAMGTRDSPTSRHEGTLADAADYEIQGFDNFCFEPDVFNVSGETKTFAIQLQVGAEYSEVHTYTLDDGRFAHLHIFEGFWTPGEEQQRLIVLAEVASCQLLVFDE